MVVHAYNPSTWEAKARALQVRSQPKLYITERGSKEKHV
jgi:hypothetical protein